MEGWKNYILLAGKGFSISVDLATPGELGNEILKKTENISDVNILTIKGKLNDDDIYNIQKRMPNLVEVDLSEVDMETYQIICSVSDVASRRLPCLRISRPSEKGHSDTASLLRV